MPRDRPQHRWVWMVASVNAVACPFVYADPPAAISAPNGVADSAVESPRSLAEITAGQDGSKATIRAGFDQSVSNNRPSRNLHALSWNWSATGSAPLGSGPDPTQIATLDGLADSAQLGLKVQGIFGSYSEPTTQQEADFRSKVAAAAAKMNQQIAGMKTDDEKKSFEQAAKVRGCDFKDDQVIVTNATNVVECILGPKYGKAYHDLFFPPPGLLLIPGIAPTVGTKSFKYLDSTSGASDTTRKTPWGIQAFLGIHFYDSLVTVGYRYQTVYKDAKQKSICPSTTSSGSPTQCSVGPLGTPIRTDQAITDIEFRRAISTHLAIAPMISYDSRASVLGVNVPIYFIPDKTGVLSGGISVGWRNDQGGIQANVIISTAFSSFPGF
jgi:hypothetical protein